MKFTFYTTLFFFLALVGFYYFHEYKTIEAGYVYPIDDTYIHMAIAKNFSINGIWGMTKFSWSSSSSSPLYTLVISICFYFFGNHSSIPLIINIIFGILCINELNKYYGEYIEKKLYIILACLFTIIYSLLYLQVVLGMEHVLQCYLMIANFSCIQRLRNHYKKDSFDYFYFFFTISLLGLVRLEMMFYILILGGLLILEKRYTIGILCWIAGFLPLFIFFYFNNKFTGYSLPYSVIVKGNSLPFNQHFIVEFFHLIKLKIFSTTFLKVSFFPIVLILMILLCNLKGNLSNFIKSNFGILLTLCTFLLHSLFASMQQVFRYEAYLLVLFSMAVIPIINRIQVFSFKYKMISLVAVSGIFFSLFYKAIVAHKFFYKAGEDIAQQQVLNSYFLNKYYHSPKIIVNDIGAICYYNDIHLLDVAGLGSYETVIYNLNNRKIDIAFQKFLETYPLKHQYDIAIVHDVMGRYTPKNWIKVAEVSIPKVQNVTKKNVFFYSISENPEVLKKKIQSFDWKNNTVKFFY